MNCQRKVTQKQHLWNPIFVHLNELSWLRFGLKCYPRYMNGIVLLRLEVAYISPSWNEFNGISVWRSTEYHRRIKATCVSCMLSGWKLQENSHVILQIQNIITEISILTYSSWALDAGLNLKYFHVADKMAHTYSWIVFCGLHIRSKSTYVIELPYSPIFTVRKRHTTFSAPFKPHVSSCTCPSFIHFPWPSARTGTFNECWVACVGCSVECSARGRCCWGIWCWRVKCGWEGKCWSFHFYLNEL